MKTKPVKIVATVGPAVYSQEKIEQLAEAGVDVFRINLSHVSDGFVQNITKWIREVEEKINKPLTIMGDLPGPKIRISNMEPDVVLEKGQQYIISKNIETGNNEGCGINQPSIIDILAVGSQIFIDDGTIKLIVEEKFPDKVITKVQVGGLLQSKKGLSAEGITLCNVGITDRDKECIALMLQYKADALAISFVQTKQDVIAVRQLLPEDCNMMLIAKIETENGVENAEEILELSEGLMVARGDLGLAVPIARVPHIQKKLIDLCVRKSKPVITATQMLESMISKPLPTRAEVTDVANAILDRTDAVMLSAETAAGKFPIETVEMMVKIIDEAVKHVKPYEYKEEKTIGNSISDSIGLIAEQIDAKLIIAFTQSGRTATRISRHRHPQPIIAVCPVRSVIRNLNFSWNVYPCLIDNTQGFENMLEQAKTFAIKNKIHPLKPGDKYVIAAGIPFGKTGTTNLILVQEV